MGSRLMPGPHSPLRLNSLPKVRHSGASSGVQRTSVRQRLPRHCASALEGPVRASDAMEQWVLNVGAEVTEVEADDLLVIEQLSAGARVGILTLVKHVATVTDLQTTASVLLDHDGRHAGLVDL